MRFFELEDIRRAVSTSAYRKAVDYKLRGHASVTHMGEDGAEIQGHVQGTRRRPYEVVVHVDLKAKGKVTIVGTCSCPVGYNCKHVATLLLESMTPSSRNRVAPSATTPPLSPEVTEWLAQLDRATALSHEDYPPAIRQRLIYVLSMAESGPAQAVLELKSVRLLKDDSFSNTVSDFTLQSAFSRTPAKYLRGNDLPILRRLQYGPTVYRGSSIAYLLSGETGAEVIERVLATGRCRWSSLTGPVLAQGPPRRGHLAWTMLASGAQQPVVSVHGGGAAVCVMPPWYVDGDAGACGLLHFDLAPRVAAVLMQAPAVEPRHVAALTGKLAEKLPQRSDLLPHEPPPTEVISEPPLPVLRLTRHIQEPQPYRALRFSWEAEEDRRTARLAFAYGPVVVAEDDRQDRPTAVHGQRLFSVERDREAERRHRRRLIAGDNGLQAFIPYGSYGHYGETYGSFVPSDPDPMAWPRFLVEVAPRLRAEGWRIDIEPGFIPPLAEADGDLEVIVDETTGIDWFELDVGVSVDGRRIDVLPHIVDLLKTVPAGAGSDFFDMEEDEVRTLLVTLDDGRLLPLPYATVKPILVALHQLFQADLAPNGGKLRLSRARVAELAAAEDLMAGSATTWSGGEALRALGRRLADTGGIGERPVPEGFLASLRRYQAQGYGWLRFLGGASLGGVLADDMGLGKTVQALAHLLAEKEHGGGDRPSLVVAPTSLMANWRMEAERFAPGLKVLALHGPDRKARFDAIPDHDVVLTTYALLPRDRDVLVARPWHAVIVDEAQNVKNPSTNAARILRQLDARQRFCLTGTPVENHLGELWALMDFLNPGLLGDRRQFSRAFRQPIEKHDDAVRRRDLARRVRPFLLRRTKAEVATELPAKTEIIEHVELEAQQRAIYEAVRLAMHRKVRDAIAAKGLDRSRIIILDALLKLRQVCCDPRLVKLPSVKNTDAGSAKLTRLMEMLEELVEEGRRVLLFSQFTSMLALIEPRLAAADIAFVKITGDVRDRETPVRRFQAGEVPVFLISLKAGGTGLNLTAADTVILYDPWWNPAVEAQAIDRSHRIGQDKPVFVHRLVTLDTIEEKMLELQKRKGALAAGLFDPEAGGPLDLTPADIDRLLAGE